MTMETVASSDDDGKPDCRLKQLFQACDTKGTGYVGRDDLRSICAELGIGKVDSDTLFAELDHNGDGRIDYNDFVKGFRDFVSSPQSASSTPPVTQDTDGTIQTASTKESKRSTANKSVRQIKTTDRRTPTIWRHFLEQLKTTCSGDLDAYTLEQLQEISRVVSSSPQLATCFEDVIRTLLQDVQRLKLDNERLEAIYKADKDRHEKHLKQIEEEIDTHVSKVEAKIREQMRQEADLERQNLKLKMDQEIDELQAHLKIFQTFDALLKDRDEDKRFQKIQNRLEEASSENRQLKINLMDTQTKIALLYSELAQVRAKYEEKCQELDSERQSTYEYLQDKDHLNSQFILLQEANKKLRDVNDSMRTVVETNSIVGTNDVSPLHQRKTSCWSLCRQGSVIGDYLQDDNPDIFSSTSKLLHEEKLQEDDNNNNNNSSALKVPLMSAVEIEVDSQYESMNDHTPQMISPRQARCQLVQEELNYGIKRFMEDLDISQPSTLINCQVHPTDDHVASTVTSPAHQRPTSPTELPKNEYEDIDLDNPQSGWAVLPVTQTTSTLRTNHLRNKDQGRIPGLVRNPSAQSIDKRQRRMSTVLSFDCFEPNGPPDRIYKVVFAGDAAVGKTTFILRICKGTFFPHLTSTLGVDFHVKTLRVDEKNVTLQLWDTAGQERFRSVTKSYFRRADGVMLLYDCTSEHSFLHVRQWITAIDEVAEKRIPIILCANKIDVRETALLQGKSIVGSEDGERLAREFSAIFIETSAKSGKNIVDALIQLTREMASNEDWEVQTSGLRITNTLHSSRKSSCCTK